MDLFEFQDYEDDDGIENALWGGLHATIFLIDADIEQDNNVGILIQKSIKCVHSILCQKIRNKDNGLNSVVFYNTKNQKNAFDFPHIFNLQDLDLSCAERILELDGLIGKDMHKFENTVGSEAGSSLHDVFWVCRNIFSSHTRKLSSRNILLFTSNDNPHSSDDHKIRQAFKGAKDLFEAYIHLEVLPLTVSFDENKFYKELLAEWAEGESIKTMAKISNPIKSFDELLERVTRLDQKLKTTAKIIFSLGSGSELALKMFTYIIKQYLPASIKLDTVANEEVFRQRKETLENGELLMKSDFIKYQTFANKKIKFMQDDIRHVCNTYEKGIELIGFKPLAYFKPFHYIKPASMLYPDEVSIKGSTKMFACLHERCLLKKVCPIVRVQARESSSTCWAFLLAQEEEIDETNRQVHPPVFFVCYLPFSDDYRNVEVKPSLVNADRRHIEAAKDIIKTYQSKFNPEEFQNPTIQTHWRVIEAYALNKGLLEEVKDSTVPKFAEIEDMAGELIEKFNSLVFSEDYDPHKPMKKRLADDVGPANKRTKPSTDSLNVVEFAIAKKVDKLNMDTLKKWLSAKGTPTTGKKKAQLVQDVYDEMGIQC